MQSLQPLDGTPLYASIEKAVGAMKDTFDPEMINAVVVLTDGKNEYGGGPNVDELIALLGNSEASGGLRVFSVAYSSGADLDTLKRISEASQAAAYDATNAASIDQVMTAVISNF